VSEEVDWVLDQLASAVTSVGNDYTLSNGDSVLLKRVDRDDSQVYDTDQSVSMETPVRDRTGELQTAAFVGATLVERAPEAIGTEYDHALETVVGLRLEGLHQSEYGHIDPDGADGVPWEELKTRVRRAILSGRTHPSVGRADTDYHSLFLSNDSDSSSDYSEYYRWDCDVVFHGYEDLD